MVEMNHNPKELLPRLVDLQPGDIIVTLSTHSLGWSHGHAGLVLNNNTILASFCLGTDSDIERVQEWNDYSCFAVLRVKEQTDEQRLAVCRFAKEHLMAVPYKLTSGVFGSKFQNANAENFGVQCAYLPWYAWKQFGVDLDSDGGKIVTPNDILHSKNLDVVQLYGFDAKEFLE